MKALPLSKLQKLDARSLQVLMQESGEPIHITTHRGVVGVLLHPQYYANMVAMCDNLDRLVKLFEELMEQRKQQGDDNATQEETGAGGNS